MFHREELHPPLEKLFAFWNLTPSIPETLSEIILSERDNQGKTKSKRMFLALDRGFEILISPYSNFGWTLKNLKAIH